MAMHSLYVTHDALQGLLVTASSSNALFVAFAPLAQLSKQRRTSALSKLQQLS